MAMIGCLGDIPFTVSDSVVRTLENMKWSGAARYAVHNRHNTHALTEFTGLEADSFTFDITLSAQLGVEPMEEITKIFTCERDAVALPLTIGGHAYGKYRWTVIKHSTKITYPDKNGDIYAAVVSISLQEYLKD